VWQERHALADIAVSKKQAGARRRARGGARSILGPDWLLGYLLVSPAIVYIVLLVAYPFFLALYYSLSSQTVAGGDNGFVGFANFQTLLADKGFVDTSWPPGGALIRSLEYTLVGEIGKALLGITLAFLLLAFLRSVQSRFGQGWVWVIRGLIMIPWTMPISLAVWGWRWTFDPQFSIINRIFGEYMHILKPTQYPDWLGDPWYTSVAIVTVIIWKGFPFSAIIVLAGLTSIPQDIFDAAKVDGAGMLRTWHYVITPMIAPILFIGLIFDVTYTLGDLTIVQLMSNGGPAGSTEILPTIAYHMGIQGGALSLGASSALILFPFLLIGMVFFLRLLYRRVD
jgi:multiple sugar transport system permease protein